MSLGPSVETLKAREDLLKETLSKGAKLLSPKAIGVLVGLLLVGGVTLGIGFATDPQKAWLTMMVNLLFWTGIAQAGVVFSAALQITSGGWAMPLKRFGEAMAGFLPISFVLFIVLYFGADSIFPWIEHPAPGKEAWLTTGRVFTVNLGGMLLLYLLSFLFLYFGLRSDIGVAQRKYHYYTQDVAHYLSAGWKGEEAEVERSQHIMHILAPAIAIMYPLVYSFLAFDFVMSLDPLWYSTLFGMYFFVGNFYIGIATIAIIAATAVKNLGLEKVITSDIFHDIGKLVFGFGIVTTYMMWSQYSIIWYSDIPEELPFVMVRVHEYPWRPVALAAISLYFVFPFLLLIFRNNKTNITTLRRICVLPIVGLLLERFLLVFPSVVADPGLPLGLFELFVSLGFLGLFGLCFIGFLSQVPIFPVSHPQFEKKVFAKEVH